MDLISIFYIAAGMSLNFHEIGVLNGVFAICTADASTLVSPYALFRMDAELLSRTECASLGLGKRV